MDVISALEEQWGSTRWYFEATADGVSVEQLYWVPPGTANSILTAYVHTVYETDEFVQGLFQERELLATGMWAGKMGVSKALPHDRTTWREWTGAAGVDQPALKAYSEAVFDAAGRYISGLKPEDLDRQVDLSAIGLGQQSLNWSLYNLVIGHVQSHTGDISALKGLQGLKGFPL